MSLLWLKNIPHDIECKWWLQVVCMAFMEGYKTEIWIWKTMNPWRNWCRQRCLWQCYAAIRERRAWRWTRMRKTLRGAGSAARGRAADGGKPGSGGESDGLRRASPGAERPMSPEKRREEALLRRFSFARFPRHFGGQFAWFSRFGLTFWYLHCMMKPS